MSELPSGTVTFLFTDIEGSTRLLKALGPDYDAVLTDHERILREAFAAARGRVVDTQGDSFFAVFARAGDAIAAATTAQLALARHAWPDGTEVRVRMGLHSGEPRATGERYIGFGVHRAARIGSAAHGGQILLSNVTRELVQDDLPPRDLAHRPRRVRAQGSRSAGAPLPGRGEGLHRDFAPLKAPKVQRPARSCDGRSWFVIAGVALAVVGVGAVLATRGSNAAPAVVANSLVKIDAATNEIVDVVEVGGDPGQVEVVGDYVFVAGQEDGTMSRVELSSGELTTSGRFDATGSIGAEGASALWSVSTAGDEVTQIDAASFEPLDAVPLPARAHALAGVGRGGWRIAVGLRVRPAAVKRWLLPTLQLARTYRLDATEFPLQIGFGGGSAWVALSVGNALLRIDAEGGDTTEIEVGNVPRDPVFGFGSVWVAMGKDGTVWRIDPRTERARASSRPARAPGASRSGRLRLGHEPLRRNRVADRPGNGRGGRDDRARPLPAVARRGRRARLGRRRGHEGLTGRVRRRVPLDSPRCPAFRRAFLTGTTSPPCARPPSRSKPGENADQTLRIAGRVMARRDMGKLVFLDLVDRSGRIQLFCQAERARRGRRRPRRHRRRLRARR